MNGPWFSRWPFRGVPHRGQAPPTGVPTPPGGLPWPHPPPEGAALKESGCGQPHLSHKLGKGSRVFLPQFQGGDNPSSLESPQRPVAVSLEVTVTLVLRRVVRPAGPGGWPGTCVLSCVPAAAARARDCGVPARNPLRCPPWFSAVHETRAGARGTWHQRPLPALCSGLFADRQAAAERVRKAPPPPAFLESLRRRAPGSVDGPQRLAVCRPPCDRGERGVDAGFGLRGVSGNTGRTQQRGLSALRVPFTVSVCLLREPGLLPHSFVSRKRKLKKKKRKD